MMMDRQRLKGWDLRLIKMVGAEMEKPFDWVTSNCAHLLAASVIACQGDEHPSLVEFEERTTEAAMRAADLEKILGSYFLKLDSILQAQRGDILLVKSDRGVAGCVLMEGHLVGRTEEATRTGSNVFRLPLSTASVGFSV